MSFGDPKCAITPGQLATVNGKCVLPYKDHRNAGRVSFIRIIRGMIKSGTSVPDTLVDEMNIYLRQQEAEAKGRSVERG
jgi:hypothetical protein